MALTSRCFHFGGEIGFNEVSVISLSVVKIWAVEVNIRTQKAEESLRNHLRDFYDETSGMHRTYVKEEGWEVVVETVF